MTTTTMRVRPVNGRLVLEPRTRQPLAAEGADVPRSSYWLRRITDGDVSLDGPKPLPVVAPVITPEGES